RITTAAEVVMRLSPWATMDADTNDAGSIQIGEGMQPVAIPAAGIPRPEDSLGESMLDEMSWDNISSDGMSAEPPVSSSSSSITPPPPPEASHADAPNSTPSQATGISTITWLASILTFTAIGFLVGYLTARGMLFH
ncbi:MAG: serine/threonine protein kinase, partial [Rhodopirellula bahusiensis]